MEKWVPRDNNLPSSQIKHGMELGLGNGVCNNQGRRKGQKEDNREEKGSAWNPSSSASSHYLTIVECLIGARHGPGALMHGLTDLHNISRRQGLFCHFTDEEMERLRGSRTCPRPRSC